MSEQAIRRILLWCLLAFAPAFVFLVQVVLLQPPAIILAFATSMGWAVLKRGEAESLLFIAFFIVHFLVFTGLYWLVARVLSHLISRLTTTLNRARLTIAVGLLIAGLALLPLYGGGGHGPTQLTNLSGLLSSGGGMGGDQTLMITFYLASTTAIGLALALLHWRSLRR